jgi:hypothetical protein
MFGRWLATEVAKEEWDVVHCWSGVSEELLEAFKDRPARTILMRGPVTFAFRIVSFEKKKRERESPLVVRASG